MLHALVILVGLQCVGDLVAEAVGLPVPSSAWCCCGWAASAFQESELTGAFAAAAMALNAVATAILAPPLVHLLLQ